MTASTATTEPMSLADSVAVSARTAPTSVMTRASSRCRSGHRIQVMSAPTSASLATPLTKLTSANLENRRLAPATGEILDSVGLSCSADQTRRCWVMLRTIGGSGRSEDGNEVRTEGDRVWKGCGY